MKKNYKTIGMIAFIIIIGAYTLFSYCSGGEDELRRNDVKDMFVEEDEEELPLKNKQIVVDVKGAVKNPNIYRLDEGGIVEDAINLAGGITSEADLSKVNRAEELVNNQEVIIPIIGEEVGEASTSNVSVSDGKININTANVTELDALPGIGPVRASDIVKYREKNGKFKTIDEIKNIKGIGESAFDKLKDSIKV